MRFAWPSAEHETCTRRTLERCPATPTFLTIERPPIDNASNADGPQDDASVFNEIFAFEYHGQDQLELDVYDWHWTSDDELLGSCAVALDENSREWRTLEHGALLVAIQRRHNPAYTYEPFAGDLHFRDHEPNTLMIGAHKVRIANHIADFQPMFRCEFSASC